MITIPNEFNSSIIKIIEWNLKTYKYDIIDHTRLNRLLDDLGKNPKIDDEYLYHLNECVSNAKNNVSECGVDKDTVDKIYNWVWPLYSQSKHS